MSLDDPIRVGKEWGIEEELWDRTWSNLSGGESQRIALATALGMKSAEVLLVDGSWIPLYAFWSIVF